MFTDILKETVVIVIGLVISGICLLIKYFFKRKPSPQPTERGDLDFSRSIFNSPTPEPDPAPIWRFIEYVPFCRRWAGRHIYTTTRICSNIRVHVNGGASGMRFYWSAEAANASISLYIVNLNPFPLTIDRIVGELTVANAKVASVQT